MCAGTSRWAFGPPMAASSTRSPRASMPSGAANPAPIAACSRSVLIRLVDRYGFQGDLIPLHGHLEAHHAALVLALECGLVLGELGAEAVEADAVGLLADLALGGHVLIERALVVGVGRLVRERERDV